MLSTWSKSKQNTRSWTCCCEHRSLWIRVLVNLKNNRKTNMYTKIVTNSCSIILGITSTERSTRLKMESHVSHEGAAQNCSFPLIGFGCSGRSPVTGMIKILEKMILLHATTVAWLFSSALVLCTSSPIKAIIAKPQPSCNMLQKTLSLSHSVSPRTSVCNYANYAYAISWFFCSCFPPSTR